MGGLGTTCIILLFSMWLVMFIGTSGSAHPLGSGFIAFYRSITEPGFGGFVQLIPNNLLVGGALAIGAMVTAYLVSSSFSYTLKVGALTALASFLFAPFSGFIGELSGGCTTSAFGCIPVEIVWLVTGVFSLLIFLAVFSFTTGGDF